MAESSKNLMKFITMAATASSEADVDYLLQLMNPTDDPEEMGDYYTQVLGYNPITYFDEKYVNRVYDEMAEDAPGYVRLLLDTSRKDIVEDVMDKFSTFREGYLINLLVSSVRDKTGWVDPKFKNYETTDDDDDDTLLSDLKKPDSGFEVDDEDEDEDDFLSEDDDDDDDEDDD